VTMTMASINDPSGHGCCLGCMVVCQICHRS